MNPRKLIPRGLPAGVWIIAASSAVVMSGFGMIVPLLPVYAEQLGASELTLGLMMAGFFVGRLVIQLPAGIVTDRLGRKTTLVLALLGYAATCIGYALSTTAQLLVFFRLLQGICSGLFSIAARCAVSELTTNESRGGAQGIYSSSVSFGFVIGPVFGSVLAGWGGYGAPLWSAAGLALAATLVVSRLGFDGAGARRPFAPATKPGCRAQGSSQAQSPLPTNRALLAACLRDPRVRLLAGTYALFTAGLSVIMTLFPIAGEKEIPGGLTFVGIAMTVSGLSGLLFAPILGRLSDRYGRVLFMLLGALITSTEGFGLLLTRSPLLIGATFFLGGIGVSSLNGALHSIVGDMTSASERGVVTGLIGMAGESGGVIGALAAPLVWSTTDLSTPFGLQVGFTAAACFFIAALWRTHPPHPTQQPPYRETIFPG